MRIKYKLPREIKPNDLGLNLIANKSYSLTISFKVDESYKKDQKMGFLGIPGKNFGISYDFEVNKFVFEYWTKKSDDEFEFHCHKDYDITENDISKGLIITIQYDVKKLRFRLYNNFTLFDEIYLKNRLVDEYNKHSLFIGCHNPGAIENKHKCHTEIDLLHFSAFEGDVEIDEIKKFFNKKTKGQIDNLICTFNLDIDSKDVIDETGNMNNLTIVNNSQLHFEYTKDRLDEVGCGFCLAKWTQVTMHLHNGMTHSCHHPSPHKISTAEIKNNPTALHNSVVKKQARKEMLEGKRPKECEYCWNIEDNSTSFSDRVYKSSEPWSEPHFEDITQLNWRENYVPKYVEVSFSNTCNFKCAYCGPLYSSKWMEEINKHGGYKLPSMEFNGLDEIEKNKTKPYKHSEDNPYVDAFWEWWPILYDNLDTFRITGGEPLLSKDFWATLDSILQTDTPNRNLKLSINSNLGVEDSLIDLLIEKISKIIDEDRVKECIIYTSCDTFGKQAEYIRVGLNFDTLFNNIDKILGKLDKVTIVVMSTFNIFSVFSYDKLIEKIHDVKLKHHNTKRYWNTSIILDTSYLRYPSFLSFKLLSNYIEPKVFDKFEDYMRTNSTYRSLNFFQPQSIEDVGFSLKEIEKIVRLKEYFIKESTTKLINKNNDFFTDLKNFHEFIIQYEIRRNLNCEEYFPELKKFIRKVSKQS